MAIALTQNKILIIVKWLLSRAFIFYLFIFLFSLSFVDYERIRFGEKVRLLDRIMPVSFGYLIKNIEAGEKPEKARLEQYILFYRKVVELFPDRADAYSMLGFCYYFHHWYDHAIDSYNKAIAIEPNYFWFHYNLAIIEYRHHRYENAIRAFNQAIQTDRIESLQYLFSSKVIFQSVWAELKNPQLDIPQRLKRGYVNSHLLSITSFYYLKDFPSMFTAATRALNSDVGSDETFAFYAGYAALKTGDYRQSIVYLQGAIKKFQLTSNQRQSQIMLGYAFKYLGESFQALGQIEKAEQAYALSSESATSQNLPLPVERLINPRIF